MLNWVAWVVLSTILLGYVLDMIASRLNLGALHTQIPSEFDGVYDAEKYKTSQEYLRENTRFSHISTTFSLMITLLFWFLGGFNSLDTFVRSFAYSDWTNGLLYIGILAFAMSILGLPFTLYSNFVIEAKYGFNTTTWKTFLKDRLLGLGLSLLLGIPLLGAILCFFEQTGESAWLWIWAVMTVFSLAVQYIAPTWIMPLFNKFEPLADGELRTAILAMASEQQFPLKDVFVIDGSKRSKKSNAFFTGFGKNKRIALYDTLVAQHTVPELVAVLAHEIGHYKKKHIIQGMVTGILQTGIVLFILQWVMHTPALYEAFYVQTPSIYTGLIFFSFLFNPVELVLSMGMNAWSRKNEFEADAFAVQATKDHEGMIQALKKLSVDNLSNLTPHPFYVFLHYSHPPVLKRIEAIRRLGN